MLVIFATSLLAYLLVLPTEDSIAIAEQAEFADALLAWEATSAGLLSGK